MILLKRGDKGANVRALQDDLVALGYKLPNSTLPDGSLDGSMGAETLNAVNMALRLPQYHDSDPTTVDGDEISYIHSLRDLVEQLPPVIVTNPSPSLAAEAAAFDPVKFQASMIDLRKQHVPHISYKENGVVVTKSYLPRLRAWKEFTGVTYHQTACDMGEREARYYSIGAHFAVLRSGRVLWMCDPNRVVYHGNGWNARCVGIEVNGLYSGLEDDPDTALDESLKTTWDDPSTPTRERPMTVTPQSMVSLRNLTRWLKWYGQKNGASVQFLVAHRQSSMDRQNDPGQTIWHEAAVPLHAELGMSDGCVGFKIGGYAIPQQWDSRCTGYAY